MTIQRTVLLIKPDAVSRGLVGQIITVIEREQFDVEKLRLVRLTRDQGERLYETHRGQPYFIELVDYITSGPVVALALAGPGAVGRLRELVGPTDPADAPAGTIRHKYGLTLQYNSVHGSDSPASALREIRVLFGGGA